MIRSVIIFDARDRSETTIQAYGGRSRINGVPLIDNPINYAFGL